MVAVGMRDDDLTIIGRVKNASAVSRVEFGISRRDRRQHIDVQGKTGTGKSTLLKRLLLQDIERGDGVCFIDPLGVIADEIVDHIPRSRINDTCYWNVADLDWP